MRHIRRGGEGVLRYIKRISIGNTKVPINMSLVPLLFRDWWEDADPWDRALPRSRLLDQHFGLGLHPSSLLRTGYVRPWRNLARQDSGSSSLHCDKDKFQVILDVQQFTPNEIVVKTSDNTVIVEAKHEEKPDEHGYVSRHFIRRYVLPKEIKVDDVVSSLSSDGVLTITAPKKVIPETPGERVVPIVQTGVPAVKPLAAEQPVVEHPKETPKEAAKEQQ